MCCRRVHIIIIYFFFQNATTFFNLFGLTEVSSWATCYQLPDAAGLVLLGNPLPDCPQQVDTAHNSNSS